MTRIIDITAPIGNDLPLWPGTPSPVLSRRKTLKTNGTNVSDLIMGVHTGTHVDAPSHFVDGGSDVEGLALDVLTGPALVVEMSEAMEITREALEACCVPTGTKRLLLKTENSRQRLMDIAQFSEIFSALTESGASWVAERAIHLIGIDYLSIQHYGGTDSPHIILLENGIVILEGLRLTGVLPGDYLLYCLPLRLSKAEGAPARAILLTE